mmetsp:Transcript_136644/g.323736  ORF Transcript_136644/g.323736 Transcript_136644/m.323736 type:complete len:228 (-) Transcript_136644:411-1094(-)
MKMNMRMGRKNRESPHSSKAEQERAHGVIFGSTPDSCSSCSAIDHSFMYSRTLGDEGWGAPTKPSKAGITLRATTHSKAMERRSACSVLVGGTPSSTASPESSSQLAMRVLRASRARTTTGIPRSSRSRGFAPLRSRNFAISKYPRPTATMKGVWPRWFRWWMSAPHLSSSRASSWSSPAAASCNGAQPVSRAAFGLAPSFNSNLAAERLPATTAAARALRCWDRFL